MKRFISELEDRAFELESKIESAMSEEMEYLYCGKLMEVARIMRSLIEMGYAELDEESELARILEWTEPITWKKLGQTK